MRRQKKQPRSSRLSLQTKLQKMVEERDTYLEALEMIADILEEVGVLDGGEEDPGEEEPGEEEDGVEKEEETEIEEEVETAEDPQQLPPEQNPSQHPKNDYACDEPDI